MIKKLSSLYNSFVKRNMKDYASIILFLMKEAGYEDEWASKIEELASVNTKPFNAWFGGNDRVVVPFQMPDGKSSIDEEVEEALEPEGYEITDYIGGYCEMDGRKFKIGKVIEKLYKRDIKDAEQRALNRAGLNDLSKLDGHYRQGLEYDYRLIKEKWDEIRNIFINSRFRKNKQYQNNMVIVFSQNPHDIARMSTERAWKSCMNLEGGTHSDKVFCEVAHGGFIAYLTTSDDINIQDPLARIHIRRFTNARGVNYAFPEDRSYGNETPGFKEAVEEWVLAKNEQRSSELGDNRFGRMTMQGGSYSDTYNDTIVNAPKDNKEELLKWLKEDFEDTRETVWIVVDSYFDDLKESEYFEDYNPFIQTLIEHDKYDGNKEFPTKEDAEAFLDRLQNSDYYEEWIDHLLPSEEEQTKLEEKGQLDDLIESFRNKRYSVEPVTNNWARDYKKEALKQLMRRHIKDLTTDEVIFIGKQIKSSGLYKYDINSYLTTLFSKRPDAITDDGFKSLPPSSKPKILNILESTYPEKAQEVKAIYNEDISELFDPDNSENIYELIRKRIKSSHSNYTAQEAKYAIRNYLTEQLGGNLNDDTYDKLHEFIFEKIPSMDILNFNPNPTIYIEKDGGTYKMDVINDLITVLDHRTLSKESAIKFAESLYNIIDISTWQTDIPLEVPISNWLANIQYLERDAVYFQDKIIDVIRNAEEDSSKNKLYINLNNHWENELLRAKDRYEKGYAKGSLDTIESARQNEARNRRANGEYILKLINGENPVLSFNHYPVTNLRHI